MQNSLSLLLTKYVSWLRYSEGINLSDKLLLFFIKVYYSTLISFLRLALGKTRSKRLILKRELDFGVIWYKSYSFWKNEEEKVINYEKFVEVNTNTVDYLLLSKNLINQEEKVNWVKIDVEGAEYEVLKGAKDILSKSSNITLLIEIHNLSAGNILYKPIQEFLSLRNFKIEFEKASESGERHIIARK